MFFGIGWYEEIEESEKVFISAANRGKCRGPLLRLTGKTLASCPSLLPPAGPTEEHAR